MLLHGTGALRRAAASGTAIPGFTAYNLETAQAICAAAESAGVPVILQAGASGFRHAGREQLARLALVAAQTSQGAVGVHLDHSRDLEEITACIRLGYTSVMVDGSHLPFTENVALTRTVVSWAKPAGVWVEAEIGALAGDEDVSTDARATAYTDPVEAARLVEETGVDALAVAVGNVHGLTTEPVRLDVDRLAAIRAACPVPLVLHGASGLPPGDLHAALDQGVAKVNVNTELRRAFLTAVRQRLEAASAGHDLAGLLAAGRQAVQHTAHDIALLLARRPEAAPPTTC
jgi:tagatose 1,6-diphosphate aldolase GatY/KbaY